jgi:recombinational DNA repair protein (RecF pathway)
MYGYDLTVDVLACPVCGYRIYPGYPTRTGKEHDEMVKQEIERAHLEMKRLGLTGNAPLSKPCAICGSPTKLNSTYCRKCRKTINRMNVKEWQHEHPEEYREAMKRHHETKRRRKSELSGLS